MIAEVELAFPFLNGPVVGHHRQQRQEHHDGDDRRHAARRRARRSRSAATSASRSRTRSTARRAASSSSSCRASRSRGSSPSSRKAAALLNLSEDHLDRYGSLAAYGAAKKRLFRDMDADGTRRAQRRRSGGRAASRPAPGGAASPACGQVADGCCDRRTAGSIEVAPGGAEIELFHAADVPLAGVHNLENAMAAALLARAIGRRARSASARRSRGFRGLPHRLQRVGERDGVVWYDDSKGTNPGATLKSLEGFAGRHRPSHPGRPQQGGGPRGR